MKKEIKQTEDARLARSVKRGSRPDTGEDAATAPAFADRPFVYSDGKMLLPLGNR